MEKYSNLPIAGCLKHGTQEGNRPKELGYFIAKVQEPALQHLLTKFNEQYDKKQEVIIHIFSEDAYSIKRVKRNQSGTICYCLSNSDKAKEKVNKKWVEKDCLEDCKDRLSSGSQKPMCQEEITLKFLIPSVSKDRVWIFQSRSYNTLKNISAYMELQKEIGNSIKGYYKLFLFQKESEKDGKKFKNYVADIVKLEENDLSLISQTSNSDAKNSSIENISNEPNLSSNKIPENTPEQKKPKKTTQKVTKQETKTETKPSAPQKDTTPDTKTQDNSNVSEATDDDFDKYYVLLNTSSIELNNQGKMVKYTQGRFINKDDKELDIILHPNFAGEIAMCDLGSQFLLDTQEIKGRLFATACKTIQKQIKEAV